MQGLDLSERFFHQIVQPLMLDQFPQLKYSGALIGPGSEVLGFDTEMSRDHDWGPRVQLFLNKKEAIDHAFSIEQMLQQKLPDEFCGFPVRYGLSKPGPDGTHQIKHRVEIFSLSGFLKHYINIEEKPAFTPAEWLSMPEQKLRSITAGRVFHDEVGLEEMRQTLAYYPPEVWLYLLASCWNRIEQEEHLMGRAGLVGDEIGSALIAARLVRDLMRLCFLMEKQYAPYAKWFGTAFVSLQCSKDIAPTLQSILGAKNWNERETHLTTAYEHVARMHNALKITSPLPETTTLFHDRPIRVISMGQFSQSIAAEIRDAEIIALVSKRLIGSIDHISDNTDILEDSIRRPQIQAFYKTD